MKRIFKLLEPLIYLYFFISKRLKTSHVSPIYAKHNCQMLLKREEGVWLDATYQGELYFINTFRSKAWRVFKDVITGGAFTSRVRRTIFFTFITHSLEVFNPFSKRVSDIYINHKVLLLRKLIKSSPVPSRMKQEMEKNLEIYRRNSLLQMRIITKVHRSVGRQRINEVILKAEDLSRRGMLPIASKSGESGTYFVQDDKQEIFAVFKPFDEEMGAPNNPLGADFQGALGQRIVRLGTRVGESAHREVGAFLVDQFLGFGLVPRTYFVSLVQQEYDLKEGRVVLGGKKKKYGSLQEYIDGFAPIHHVSEKQTYAIPIHEFHLLMVLDVIIGNLDRNYGNIMIGDEELVAIDHGLSFPDSHRESLSIWYWTMGNIGEKRFPPSLVKLMNNFPFEQLSFKLKQHCFFELPIFHRMRERIALFAAGLNANLIPIQLFELMQPTHLTPLHNLDETLPLRAKEVVQNYLSALQQRG
ncbi:MAG: hypothetical protein S4CHLAM45_11250 [Chlamydiales bacterium]|nr:hypothetical protein [Chlamydiales bacterium]MCH9619617.1 hypothetical protein [Chlamydiales bacterium]MCH9623223.1 hypothetical protein [Chlamydiales bacterium]